MKIGRRPPQQPPRPPAAEPPKPQREVRRMDQDDRNITIAAAIGGAALLGTSAMAAATGLQGANVVAGFFAIFGGMVFAPSSIALVVDGVKGLLGMTNRAEHAFHAHELAKESIHTP